MKVAQLRPDTSDVSLVLQPLRVLLRLETRRLPESTESTDSSNSPATTMLSLVAGDETGTVRVVLWDAAAETVCPSPTHALTTLPLVLRRCCTTVVDGCIELRLMDGLGTVALLAAETAAVPAPPVSVNTAVDISATIWEPIDLTFP